MALAGAAPLTPPPHVPRREAETPRASCVARSFFVSHVAEASVDDVVREMDVAAQDAQRGTCGLAGVYRCPAGPPHADTPWRTRFPLATLLCVCRTEEVAVKLRQRCVQLGWVVTPARTLAVELARRATQDRVLDTFLSRAQVLASVRLTNGDAAVQPARQSHRLFAALLSGRTRMWPSEVLGRAALVGGTAVVVDEVDVARAYLRLRRAARRRRSSAPVAAAPAARVEVERAVRTGSPLQPRMSGGGGVRGATRRLEMSLPPPPSSSASSSSPSPLLPSSSSPASGSQESYGFVPCSY